MNSYQEKVIKDITEILGVEEIMVSQDCIEQLVEYVSAQTRQSFLNGLKRKVAPTYPKSALQAGKLQPVERSE